MRITLLFLAILNLTPMPHSANAQSQGVMNQQIAVDLKEENARLQNVYEKLFSAMGDTGKEKLSIAQKSWEIYRDFEADFEADKTEGGSMRPGVLMGVKLRLTQERISILTKELSFIKEMDKILNNKNK